MRTKGKRVEMLVTLSPVVASEVRRIAGDLELSHSRVVSLLVEDGLASLSAKGGRKLARLRLSVHESLEVVSSGRAVKV